MTRAVSIELFDVALDEYEADADLDNMAIEVTLPAASADHLIVDRYPIPRTGPYARHTAPKRSVRPRPAR
jgi:hypothetical protein